MSPYFVTFERKTTSGQRLPGINWLIGNIEVGPGQMAGPFGYVESSGGIVIGTNASTVNTQMSLDPSFSGIGVNFIRQQGSPGKIYSHYLYLYKHEGYWEYGQIDDGMISYNSPVNFSPSIVSLPNYYYASCWVEYANTVFYSLHYKVRYYYDSNVQSSAINQGGSNSLNSGFMVWSRGTSPWSNKSIRFDNGVPVSSSIQTLSTSGKYVQVGNSASSNLSYMYCSSFYPFSSPYYFNTSGTLAPLSKGTPEMVTGRGFEINNGDATFSYIFSDLTVDGKNIAFVDASDELDYGTLEILNNALITEPFLINKNSGIVFLEKSGFADSSAAAKKLGKNGFINFKLEIVDEATGKVIAPIKSENLNSTNSHSIRKPAYLLNTNGLAGKTIRIKISTESNMIEKLLGHLTLGDSLNITDHIKAWFNVQRSNLILIKSFKEENETINKTFFNNLNVDLDIPKIYALAQNFPNPFNPTTTINYQIKEDGLVTLKLYDILGEEITTLVNEAKTTGRYTYTFDGSDLPSGVYIYQLKVNDFVSSKKLILLK